MPPIDPKSHERTQPNQPSVPMEDRIRHLERDVRDLQIALERHRSAFEALAGETKKLGTWVGAIAHGIKEITESRIWSTLAWVGGLILSISTFGRRRSATVAPAEVKGPKSDYQRWITDFEQRDDTAIQLRLANFINRPRISIITPCFESAPQALKKTVASVLAQSCSEWELCVAGDFSKHVLRPDPRIRTKRLERQPRPAEAWDAALELASGEYIALLEPGGVLAQ